MREIENALNGYPSRVIEHATIVPILENLGYKRVNDKISDLKKKEILTPLKNGYYLYNPIGSGVLLSKEIVANVLFGPSAVSLDFALSFYGLIPESVHEITSITTKRTKIFKTPIGVFSYKQIKKELFNIGLEIGTSKNGNFMIACKERSLCDKIYFTKGVDLRSQKTMTQFLEDDLRIDMDELIGADMEIFKEYAEASKSKKVQTLMKVVEGVQK